MVRIRLCILLLVALIAAPQITFVSQAEVAKPHRAGLAENLEPLLKASEGPIPVLIRFASRPTIEDKQLLLEAGFLEPMVRYEIVPVLQAVGPAASIKKLLSHPRIKFIEHDAEMPLAMDRATQVSRAADVWGAEFTADGAQLHGITGKGVGVAVVDTGVDATHPDLLHHSIANRLGVPAKTVANLRFVGRDSLELYDLVPGAGPFLEANALATDVPDTDTDGHGTHVAGITSGNGEASKNRSAGQPPFKGAAPGANLIGFGAGDPAVGMSLALGAFDWIHKHHKNYNIRVVNNSWGGDGDWNPDFAITIAARKLVNEDGIAVVFAAGNDGGDGTGINTNTWANIPEMISVGNYYDRSGWVADSSSRGDKTKQRTWPHVSAPGTQIISTAAHGKTTAYACAAADGVRDEAPPFIVPSEAPNTEPTTIPVPLPTTLETDLVDGEGEVVGPYTSCTGTSMAAPHVAGVIALILEANPDLKPLVVRQILMETANMPVGRNYEADGFAIGHGVVDAAEAVAVALKMREGLSLKDALRLAYVDYGSDSNLNDAALNSTDPRYIEIKSPKGGTELSGSTIKVAGKYNAGPVTNNSVPLASPFESRPITGDANIYQQGLVNPFANTDGRVSTAVVAGTNVTLQIRFIDWNEPSTVPPGSYPAEHRIYRSDGSTLVNFTNTSTRLRGTEWSTTGTAWAIPENTPVGNYVFEGAAFAGGVRYVMDRLPFRIVAAGTPSAPAGISSASSGPASPAHLDDTPLGGFTKSTSNPTFFSTDFEGGDAGWTVTNDGFLAGSLTTWSFIDQTTDGPHITWTGTHSGDKMFYVGDLDPTANYVSGVRYEDLANTSLISPEIDLSDASSPQLSYWRVGGSESDFDFLKVYAAQSGSSAWEELGHVSGTETDWTQATANLTSFAGETIRLRFEFTSDLLTPEVLLPAGWYLDDIVIQDGPPMVPRLSALPSFGVGSLDSTLSYSVTATTSIKKVVLDFGDGTSVTDTVTGTSVSGSHGHSYGPGFFSPKVTAYTATGDATAETTVDVAPVNTIQVRIDRAPWVSARSALNDDRKWSALLDLAGLPAGNHPIHARHCDSNAHCIHDTVDVIKVDPVNPSLRFVPNEVSVGEGAGSVKLSAKLREESGSPLTVTFTTVDGTAKAGEDYTDVTGTLTFAPGETKKTITVPITNDNVQEGDETFKVVATDGRDRTFEALVTIVSKGPPPKDNKTPGSSSSNGSWWIRFLDVLTDSAVSNSA